MVAHLVQDTGKHCTLFFINMRDRELMGEGYRDKKCKQGIEGGTRVEKKKPQSGNQAIRKGRSGYAISGSFNYIKL
jgi:hypothetical protein